MSTLSSGTLSSVIMVDFEKAFVRFVNFLLI